MLGGRGFLKFGHHKVKAKFQRGRGSKKTQEIETSFMDGPLHGLYFEKNV